jgi:hypothetical protein
MRSEAVNVTGGSRKSAALALTGALGFMLSGCTMCPELYDYSGPVPNGSAPQNDFRARSNGVAPIGNAPRPWPPLVKHDRPDHEQSILVAGEQSADNVIR